jgi:hypothetical protein
MLGRLLIWLEGEKEGEELEVFVVDQHTFIFIFIFIFFGQTHRQSFAFCMLY